MTGLIFESSLSLGEGLPHNFKEIFKEIDSLREQSFDERNYQENLPVDVIQKVKVESCSLGGDQGKSDLMVDQRHWGLSDVNELSTCSADEQHSV